MPAHTEISARTAYFDCFNGAAGDMIVAALLDAGADADALRAGLSSLKLTGYDIRIERTVKQGLAATRFIVELDRAHQHSHRHLKDIKAILERASIAEVVRERAVAVFEQLAQAEAEVHGTTVDKVHFHEVGAVDAIVDVVGACLALKSLDVRRVVCSPLPLGSGTVECEHGIMPVPAPATSRLLIGVPIATTDEPGELTTPTGAALLSTLASGYGPIPPMTLSAVGCGAGARDGRRRANILRVLLGCETAGNGADVDGIVQLETNVDSATPEVLGHCMERLMAAGALDVFATPIQMKKWRPGVLLTVLASPSKAAEMEQILFAETGTIGIRWQVMSRTKLPRRHETVRTPYGEVRMKIAEAGGRTLASPEYEDCKSAAAANRVPLRDVIAAAEAAWRAGNVGDRAE